MPNKALSSLNNGTPVVADTGDLTYLVQNGSSRATHVGQVFGSSTLFKQSGTGAVSRTIQAKLREIVSPEDFGAVGDGTTVDTTAMQSALTAAAGKTLRFQAGATYKLTDELTLPAGGIDIEGQGATLDFSTMAAGASLGDKVGLSATGTLGDAITVGANITAGDTQIAVTSTATLAVGNLVRISSTQFFMDGVSSGTNLRGELHRILTIDDATNFSIEGEMLFSYTTAATAVVRKITPVSFLGVSNLNLTMGGVGSAHAAMQVTYGQDVDIQDVNVLDAEDVGIGLITCFGGRVENCRARNSTSPGGAIGVTGYGVALYDATRDVVVEGLRAENCRHAVAGGRTYPVVFITVSNCSSDDSGLSAKAFDCHEPCFYWTFKDNKVTGGEGGFVIRGQYITLRGNHVERTASNGIQVEMFITNTDGQSGIVIDGNTILNTGSNGILLDGTEGVIKHAVISNNVCRANELNAIYTWLIQNVRIADNDTEGATGASGTQGNGYYIDGDTSNHSQNVSITGCGSKGQPRSGILADFVDGLVISGFESEGNALHAIELTNCTDVDILGGGVEASGNAASNAVSSTSCDRVSIIGLKGTGSTSNATSDGVRASGTSKVDLTVVGCTFHNFGRAAVNVTGTDHVIIVGNNGRTCSAAAKFLVAGASNVQMHSNLPLTDGATTITVKRFQAPIASTLTIATGAVTATGSYHLVDTEGAAASDDLDTINGGVDGSILIIRAANSARTVVAKDGTGNLQIAGDCTLDNAQDTLTLFYVGALSAWLEIARSDNGA